MADKAASLKQLIAAKYFDCPTESILGLRFIAPKFSSCVMYSSCNILMQIGGMNKEDRLLRITCEKVCELLWLAIGT